LAAVNALGANQREHSLGLADVKSELTSVKTDVAALKTDVAALMIEFVDFRQETRTTFRSVDEQLSEIKDLIIDRHTRDQT
jgi:archaellum component FlaC